MTAGFPTFDLAMPMPADTGPGIGIVGAGAIVNAAHLPAYRQAGFNVVAIADVRRDAAEPTARRYGIDTVHDSVGDLLADERVAIVDIAVDPVAQKQVGLDAVKAGKQLLCQKPLSESLADAAELVDAARQSGILLAVNQQMRWDPLVRAYKQLLDGGFFGQVTSCLFDLDITTDFAGWQWMAGRSRLEYFYHSIHHLDSIRYLLGDPIGVTAVAAHYPHQAALGESRTTTILDYPDELRVVLQIDHNNWAADTRAVVRLRGTEGQADGTLGLLNDYPQARPDRIGLVRREAPARRLDLELPGSWVPDAFIGPMAELMCAMEQRREPATSGRDNLRTLKIVHAAYRAVAEQRRVEIEEIVDA